MLKDEINGNNKISVRHQDGSFKVEIKEEKKEIKKSDNDNDDDYDLIYIDKWPLHPRDRIRRGTKDNDEVVCKEKTATSLRQIETKNKETRVRRRDVNRNTVHKCRHPTRYKRIIS